MFHSWDSDNLPKSQFQISWYILLKQFSNHLPTTKDKVILSSFHLLQPDSCIDQEVTFEGWESTGTHRDGSVFLTVTQGGRRTNTEAHALFRNPFISLPVLLLLAGLLLQVKEYDDHGNSSLVLLCVGLAVPQ